MNEIHATVQSASAPSAIPAGRTLTVACGGGLSNRVRLLVSGLALAEATGRQFTMWWPRTPACAATFEELFEDTWNVIEVERAKLKSLPHYGGALQPPVPDILTTNAPHVALYSPAWLIAPHLYPAHASLSPRAVELLETLTPVTTVRRQVEDFYRTHFRPTMIGVHLRRGDFHRHRPEAVDNTVSAMAAVDTYLRAAPDAGILLCTDDGAKDAGRKQLTQLENVRDKFVRRYGQRVVMTTPRSLARDCPEAIQDALVDLLLLRRTDYVVGTEGSSFSELAYFGRPVPYIQVGTDSPRHRLITRVWQVTRLDKLLTRAGAQRFGKQVAYPHLVRYYRRQRIHLVQDILRFTVSDLPSLLARQLQAVIRRR